jgi:hypothetical protein
LFRKLAAVYFAVVHSSRCTWFYRKGNVDPLLILDFGVQFGIKTVFSAGMSDGYYDPKIVYPKPPIPKK